MPTQTQAHNPTRLSPNGHNVVAVRLEQRTYALPLQSVVQIIPIAAITSLPQAHPAIEGILNFRGQAVLVINMRRYLHLPEARPNLYTPIVLVQIAERMVGLIVDEVLDVTAVQQERVARLADILPEGLGKLPILQGLTHTDSGAMLLLNLEHLFGPEQARLLSTALESLDAQELPELQPEMAGG